MEHVIGGFITNKDVTYVLKQTRELIRDYGRVTLADIKDIAGTIPAYEDTNVVWDEKTFKHAVPWPKDGFRSIVLLSDDEYRHYFGNGIYIFI